MFIKSAAMLFKNGMIIEGKDYSSILSTAYNTGITSSYIIGFIDSHDNFMDRGKAAEVAIAAGQVPADFTDLLAPEDLLPEKENDCAS